MLPSYHEWVNNNFAEYEVANIRVSLLGDGTRESYIKLIRS